MKPLEALQKVFGHESFRLEQKNVIDTVMEGLDCLAIMPTGGGKSVCFQIPALCSEGVTLVISPLISLMQDQVLQLNESGVPACFINSDLSFQEKMLVEKKIVNGDYKLIYISPEGLLSDYQLKFFKSLNVSHIAIDEAHCVSQWGHEFRGDYRRLSELKNHFPNVPIIALTATADERTREDIVKQLKFVNHREFISSFDRPNINYQIFERADEIKQLDSFIKSHHKGETGIVYCLSRKKVERVAEQLCKLGHQALAYHAGLNVEVKKAAQHAFNTQESIIIVATIAFGMGINRPDVRFVGHLDLPKSIESYYQETGRAGRDNYPASAWMVYGLQDVMKLSRMLETTEADESYKIVARGKLNSMLSLCEVATCRRKHLLGYFNEELKEDCGNCDNCLNPPESWDATIDCQKILSTIYRTQQIYGANHIIEVLRGSKSIKVLEKGHDQLSVHGIGKDKNKRHWSFVIRSLINSEYIVIRDWTYQNLCLSAKSLELLKGQVKVSLRKQTEKLDKAAKTNRYVPDNNHGRDELFEELRLLRKNIAEQKGIPPYIVFPDKSLHDMCHLLPRNNSDFLLVNGVGVSKKDKYGKEFLEVISQYL